jgi:DNA gyrase subunit B
MSVNKLNSYDASNIVVLKNLDAVKARPGMYIGDTGERGFHHLFKEVLDNSIDEAMNGFATSIYVKLHDDEKTIEVRDNGRGIPVDIHKDSGVSALEVIMTTLHAGGKFDNDAYKGGAGGLHGVGVSCVNALSEYLEVVVQRKGEGIFYQKYEDGAPVEPVKRIKDSTAQGTLIKFKPNPKYFKNLSFNEEKIKNFLQEAAFLNAGLILTFYSKQCPEGVKFQFSGGISDYVKSISKELDDVYPTEPVMIKGKQDNIVAEVSFQYSRKDGETIHSFANNIRTLEGGSHVSGMKKAFTRVVNAQAVKQNILKDKDSKLTGEDIRDGMLAVISVRLPQAQFESQTKNRLTTSEAETVLNSVVGESLVIFFEKNPAVLKQIVERALSNQRARDAAKKSFDAEKKKSILKYNRPEKLKDCISKKSEDRELFLVEGNSAAGSATDGRDNYTQAVLPIKGKIINAEKTDFESLFANKEVQSLISSIGTGIQTKPSDKFNLNDCKYNKIIIMTDADIDGAHIAILLLTFFWRYMKPLVEAGKIYFAQPPLYKTTLTKDAKGKEKDVQYFWDHEEMKKYLRKNPKAFLTRFKGLGEMKSGELGLTTMDKRYRKLIQITALDAQQADGTLSIVMGKDAAPRKAMIIDYTEDEK